VTIPNALVRAWNKATNDERVRFAVAIKQLPDCPER
jgi:hypothetical protein